MLVACASILTACAGYQAHRDGMALMDAGKVAEGMAKLEEAKRLEPGNMDYRMDVTRAREQTVTRLIMLANAELAADRPAGAEAYYRQALLIDPENRRAQSGLETVAASRRHEVVVGEAQALFKKGEYEAASARLKPVFLENPNYGRALALQRQINDESARRATASPTLGAAFRKPVTLQFRDANLRMVFESISRISGLNLLLDKDVRADLKVSVFVKDTSVEDTVNLILTQNQLDRKVLSENTLFVYPATAAKQREYQELKVRSFHLAHADSKQMLAMIKAILKTKDAFIHEKTNSLIIRDTAEAIKVAEKLIADQDIPDPDVMLEVEVLEIARTRLTQLGIQFPDQLLFTPQAPGGGAFTAAALSAINKTNLLVSPIPTLLLQAHLDDSDTRVLASPRIRVRNREKAKIHIGDRVPVLTNSVTPVSTGAPVVTGSVQYLDVGLKLDVEPDIHPDSEVGIKMTMEVSSIVKEVTNTVSGSLAYQIGTRTASTMLRLKDGETQVLAGLIDDEGRRTSVRVPGLGDIPILGNLFGTTKNDVKRTEIVLAITPRLVGRTVVPDAANLEHWSGTEASVRSEPQILRQVGAASMSGAAGAVPPGAPGTGAPGSGAPRTLMTPRAAPGGTPAAPPPAPAAPGGAGVPGAAASPGAAVAGLASTAAAAAAGSSLPLAFTWRGPNQARVGDTVTLTLNGRIPPEATQLSLRIGVDGAVLRPVDATDGGVFAQGAAGAATFTPGVDAGGGQITLEMQRPSAAASLATGSLATVRFEVIGESKSTPVTVDQVVAGAASGEVIVSPTAPFNLVLNP
jgi:general secretion pathway protein D